MRELKPKLILADSGKRRRGSGGFWSFLSFLIIFGLGVYVGTKLDDFGIIDGERVRNKTAITKGEKNDYGEKIDEANDGDITPYRAEESVAPKEPAVIISEKLEAGLSENTDDSGNVVDSGLTSLDPEEITSEIGDEEQGIKEMPSDNEGEPTQAEREESQAEETGSYTLQIAAFAKPEDAQKAVKYYRDKGFNAYTVQVDNSRGEKWNLVKIGKFSSIEEAWDHSAVFERREGKEAYVETLSQATAVNESWDKGKKKDQASTITDTP